MSSPQLLSNRYEIGDTLGYGGMSEVHRGRDIRLGRDVAVKVLRADLARDPTFQLRFRREAQNAAALNHPAIVAVYDTGETDSDNGPLPYIVMEYVDGRTLRDIVKSEGPLAPRRAMEVMADASAALDFSHRHGIVHRDVKPANIMITRSGAVKVMDFGIARAVADGQAAVTQTAAVIGTAQYLSPEQARGESVDARSDVYAAGCVLFELLTGEPPFTGDSPVAVAYQHVREDPRKPSDVNPQVPASLDAVVLKALSKNPVNRYQSAAEMRADLVRVLSGQRPRAPMVMSEEERTSMMAAPPSATEVLTQRRPRATDMIGPDDEYGDFAPPKRRKRWRIAALAAASVAIVALLAWLAIFLVQSSSANSKIAVGSYVNMPSLAAQSQAQSDGWPVSAIILQRPCVSQRNQVNQVVRQSPAPGTLIDPHNRGQLTLCVGTGPAQVQVPDLTGQTVDQAQQTLARAQLTMAPNPQQRDVTDRNLDGKVVDWNPRAGTTVDSGSAVTVVVGKWVPQATVPNVVSLTFDQAQAVLTPLGFQINKVVQDSDQPANVVINQDPAAKSQAQPGSTVTLFVSNGTQFAMPNLSGKTQSAAEQYLQSLGWTGTDTVQYVATNDPNLNNKVVNSNPPQGTKVSKNQQITLLIGIYEGSQSTTSSPPSSGFPFGFNG